MVLFCALASRREPLNMHSELYQIFHDKYWIAAFEDKRSKKGFADAKAAMKKSVEECISGSFQVREWTLSHCA